MTQTQKTLIFLIITILSLLIFNLGGRPVSKIQEVRIAETAREMAVSGDYIVPRYNGELRLQKPPLPYWATVASYKAFGINEFSVRLPAVLFGLLTALVLFIFIKNEASLMVASNAFLIAVTSFIGIRYFRSGEADAMLLCFISLACVIGYGLITRTANQIKHAQILRWLFGLSIGLAFLSKGPAGVAIPLLALLLFAWQQKKLPQFKQCFSFSGVVIFLIVAFAWYGWIFWQLPDIAQHFMSKQLDETFVSGTHPKHFYWYFAHFFEFFMPWGFLLPLAIFSSKQRLAQNELPAYVQFAWAWLIVVLVLLTFTVNKQMQYALLFLPPVAIIFADYVSAYFQTDKNSKLTKINRGFFIVTLLILAAVMLYFGVKKWAIDGIWLLAIMLLAVSVFYFLNFKNKTEKASVLLVTPSVLVISLSMLVVSVYAEQYVSKEPRKTAAQQLMAELNNKAEIQHALIYQAMPGDGAYSYYAKQIITPIKDINLAELISQKGEIFWIAEAPPINNKIKSELIKKIDDAALYRLSLNTSSPVN